MEEMKVVRDIFKGKISSLPKDSVVVEFNTKGIIVNTEKMRLEDAKVVVSELEIVAVSMVDGTSQCVVQYFVKNTNRPDNAEPNVIVIKADTEVFFYNNKNEAHEADDKEQKSTTKKSPGRPKKRIDG